MFSGGKLINKFRGVQRRLNNKLIDISLVNLKESQFWSIEKLKSFQTARLLKIVKYVYKNIPGYRKKYNQIGLIPSDIKTLDDLKKIPLVTRIELQENLDFINKKKINNTMFTGGSTGESLRYYDSYGGSEMRDAVWHRGWSWFGYSEGMRVAIIQSAQVVMKQKNFLNLYGGMNEKNMKNDCGKIIDFKPIFIRGYVSSVYILARYIVDHGINIPGIKSVSVTSENLYDFQREAIEEAFQCRVYNEYGCNDGGAGAWECEQREGLHCAMERAIFEEVDGEMVVTDLWNLAMPFVRYVNGDSMDFIKKRCPCGRELERIEVRGRQNDIIISPAGPVSPSYLIHHGIGCYTLGMESKFRSGIRAVQYVQYSEYRLVINVVKNSWCKKNEYEMFKKNVFKIVPGMSYQFIELGEIPSTKKGKRSFIINNDAELLKKFNFINSVK